MDTDHKITMDLEWKTPVKTFGELKAYRVRYGRINQQQLTDILITDPNVHHQEISGLEKGIEYEFRVAGVNTVGPGQESIKYYLTPEGENTSDCWRSEPANFSQEIFSVSSCLLEIIEE